MRRMMYSETCDVNMRQTVQISTIILITPSHQRTSLYFDSQIGDICSHARADIIRIRIHLTF